MELPTFPSRDPLPHELDDWAKDWHYEAQDVLVHRDGLRLRFESGRGGTQDRSTYLADIEDDSGQLVVDLWTKRGLDAKTVYAHRVVLVLFKQGQWVFRARPPQ